MRVRGFRSGAPATRSVVIATALSLMLLAAAVVVVLSGSPLVLAGSNSVSAEEIAGSSSKPDTSCQAAGTLPGGTSAIRVSLSTYAGPKVSLRALSHGVLVTSGERAPGWGVAETVTVPVKRVPRTIPGAEVCVSWGLPIGTLQLNGEGEVLRTSTTAPVNESALALRLEYLRPGHQSWWSRASSVAHRMGFGHAPGGTWVVFLLIAIMIAIAALASRLVLLEMR